METKLGIILVSLCSKEAAISTTVAWPLYNYVQQSLAEIENLRISIFVDIAQ